MNRKPEVLAADSVREKRRIAQQIKITHFAKKMKATLTLSAEGCCDTYHQNELRRDGSEGRKHPKRVWRWFVFYTVVRRGIPYDKKQDELGAGIILHDTVEDVSTKILDNIKRDYGATTFGVVDALSRRESETIISYIHRIVVCRGTTLGKLCDSIENFLSMLDEYYAGLPSADLRRLEIFMRKKIFPLIVIVSNLDLVSSRYAQAIQEALGDLILCYREAQAVITLAKK